MLQNAKKSSTVFHPFYLLFKWIGETQEPMPGVSVFTVAISDYQLHAHLITSVRLSRNQDRVSQRPLAVLS